MRWLRFPAVLLAIALGASACGGDGGPDVPGDAYVPGKSFDCRSKCPNSAPRALSTATYCKGTPDGDVCVPEIVEREQCRHDREICDSSGTTDLSATDEACSAQRDTVTRCFECAAGMCPSSGDGPSR